MELHYQLCFNISSLKDLAFNVKYIHVYLFKVVEASVVS